MNYSIDFCRSEEADNPGYSCNTDYECESELVALDLCLSAHSVIEKNEIESISCNRDDGTESYERNVSDE